MTVDWRYVLWLLQTLFYNGMCFFSSSLPRCNVAGVGELENWLFPGR